MSLRNLRMTSRALLCFGIICSILVILGGAALLQMATISKSVDELRNNWLPSVRQAGKMQAAGLLYRLDARRFVIDDNRMSVESLGKLDQAKSNLKKEAAAYDNLVSSDAERTLYNDVILAVKDYEAVLNQMVTLGGTADTTVLGQYIRDVSRPSAIKMQEAIEALVKVNELGAQASADDAQNAFRLGVKIVVFLVLGAIALTILIAVIFTQSIIRPVRALVRVTQDVAKRDLTSKIEVDGSDELTELQSATAAMGASLRETIDHIAQSSNRLASAAEEMSSITHESTQGAQRQSRETEMAAAAVNEMTAAVEEVARNASSASQSTQTTQRSTVTGKERVNLTIESISRLNSSVSEASTQVEGLAGQVQNIANVLDVIRSIAEQTNLLALNAAIEAARAGEQGRGFAVVADEVRALAHRTQSSTYEIESMIQNIQKDSSAAVLAMSRSSKEAQATLSTAREAGDSIGEITLTVADISERNLMIAAASEQQASVARSVDRNIGSIRDLALQSASTAHQTAEASQDLSRLAVDLNRLVSGFKI